MDVYLSIVKRLSDVLKKMLHLQGKDGQYYWKTKWLHVILISNNQNYQIIK